MNKRKRRARSTIQNRSAYEAKYIHSATHTYEYICTISPINVRGDTVHRHTHIPTKWPADFYFVNVRRRELDENHNKNKCMNTITRTKTSLSSPADTNVVNTQLRKNEMTSRLIWNLNGSSVLRLKCFDVQFSIIFFIQNKIISVIFFLYGIKGESQNQWGIRQIFFATQSKVQNKIFFRMFAVLSLHH